ncbi:MAG: GNAT family N-acetyltransferase [Labilibaculum antarcticum]
MTTLTYSFVELDLDNQNHQTALFNLMNAYMLDRMGCEKPLQTDSFQYLFRGLQKQTNYIGVLVKGQDKYIALANCFVNFSTFQINIHNLIVLPDYRGKGLGRFLMQSVDYYQKQRLLQNNLRSPKRQSNSSKSLFFRGI